MRKATSMKELNERRQQTEEMDRLRFANRQQAEELRDRKSELDAAYKFIKEKEQHIVALQKDIDGMVRVHKEQVKTIGFYKEQVERHDEFAKRQGEIIRKQTEEIERLKQGPDNGQMEVQEKLKLLEERIKWLEESEKNTDADITKLFEEVNKLATKAEDKASPQNDVVYKDAMFAMNLTIPPTENGVNLVRKAIKKYPHEIANSKEFYAWCTKWGKELFTLLGM